MHLDVRFSCDLANVPPVAADAFKASGIGCSPGGLTDHGARGGLRPALVAPGARPGRSRPARPPLPAPPAARAVSDAATGIASVLIVAEVERAASPQDAAANVAARVRILKQAGLHGMSRRDTTVQAQGENP